MKTSFSSFAAAIQVRITVVLLAIIMAITPCRSYALFGVGDIVHDPLLYVGMMGQTGAQLVQLVQMYVMFQDMRNRVGSLKNIKDWKSLLRRYAKKEISNLTNRIFMDIRSRGARISSETPTNPIYQSMIEGRRALNKMDYRFRSGTVLSSTYAQSDYSVAKMDRAAVERQRAEQQRINQAIADGADSSEFAPPASANGNIVSLYTNNGNQQNAGSGYPSGSGSYGTQDGENPGVGADVRDPGETPGSNFAKLNTTYAKPQNDYVTEPSFNPAKFNPEDKPSLDSLSMVKDAHGKLMGAYFQEMDGAVEVADKGAESLEEAKEVIDRADMKGPEPYLQHMIAQNDTLIAIERFRLRAERALQEAKSTEKLYNQMKEQMGSTKIDATNANIRTNVFSSAAQF